MHTILFPRTLSTLNNTAPHRMWGSSEPIDRTVPTGPWVPPNPAKEPVKPIFMPDEPATGEGSQVGSGSAQPVTGNEMPMESAQSEPERLIETGSQPADEADDDITARLDDNPDGSDAIKQE